MAKTTASTALNQLQDQIDAIRREAYAAGYAAAMQSIRDFVSKQDSDGDAAPAQPAPGRQAGRRRGRPPAAAAPAAPIAAPVRRRQRRTAVAAKPAARGARGSGARPSRGNNARMIEEILQASAPRALRPAEIRTALQREKGVAMAFTSIRHALGQLEGRRAAEQVGDSKTWRFTGGASGSN